MIQYNFYLIKKEIGCTRPVKVNLKENGQNDRNVQNDITIYVEY